MMKKKTKVFWLADCSSIGIPCRGSSATGNGVFYNLCGSGRRISDYTW